MRHRLPRLNALLLAAALLCTACGGSRQAPAAGASPQTVRLEACDDGGSGGVVVDGVCL